MTDLSSDDNFLSLKQAKKRPSYPNQAEPKRALARSHKLTSDTNRRFPSFDGDVQHEDCCDNVDIIQRRRAGMPRRRLETVVALTVASTFLIFFTMHLTIFHNKKTSSTKYLSTKQVSIDRLTNV